MPEKQMQKFPTKVGIMLSCGKLLPAIWTAVGDITAYGATFATGA